MNKLVLIVGLILLGGLFYGLGALRTQRLMTYDEAWHYGYKSCEQNYNLTSDEIMALNEYRIKKLENKTEKVYLYYNIDDPTKTYIYENGTYVEYSFNATTNTYWRVK